MECKYNTHDYNCNEEVWRNSDYCILHVNFPDVDNLFSPEFYDFISLIIEKDKKLKEKQENPDLILHNRNIFNFSGAILHNVDFSGKKIDGDLWFGGSIIYGNLDFFKSAINGDIYFNGSIIQGSINFKRANINGNATFMGCKIKKQVNFIKVNINGDINFNYAILSAAGIFRQAVIDGFAYFGGGYKVNGYTDFRFIEINKATIFYGANFEDSDFSDASFKKFVDFRNANFNKKVTFQRTKFYEHAQFENVVFSDDVDFEKSNFNGGVYFVNKSGKNVFEKYVNFKDTSFLRKGLFEDLKIFNASFESSELKKVAFLNCNLCNVRFKNVRFDDCELYTCYWCNYDIPEFTDYKKCKQVSAKSVADTYRRIKKSLLDQGDYDIAGNFYLKEMNLRKEHYYNTKNVKMGIFYSILSFLSEYGETSKRLFIILIVYLTIYAILYSNYDTKLILPLGSGVLSILTALFVYVFARKMAR